MYRDSLTTWIACVAVGATLTVPARSAQIIYPSADGTLADGGVFGRRDGVADSWDWSFGPGGFSGAVTLSTETPDGAVEHRIVCEYDLRTLNVVSPLAATLTFTVRGVSVAPFPDVAVHVYSYPADLVESPGDFAAGPAVLRGVVPVSAMQPSMEVAIDVTSVVASALQSGVKRVAFRFQMDPRTPHATNQAFIDAIDGRPQSKPFLTIYSALAGDADDDGDVDLQDFAYLTDCLAGPDVTPAPVKPGFRPGDCLRVFDRDADADVDLDDLSLLLGYFARE